MNLHLFKEYLLEFSPRQREIIAHTIDFHTFNGVIPSSVVKKLLEISTDTDTNIGSNISDVMLKFLPLARHYALPTTSEFYVGAVVEGKSGALYLGANLEIHGESLSHTIHAEQSAINNALLNDEHGVSRIAITHSPCGHCRQFLNEMENAAALEIVILGRPALRLKDLLPEPFGPLELGSSDMLFSKKSSNSACHAFDCPHSYAPHTGSFATVSLNATVLSNRTDPSESNSEQINETIEVTGVYLENAAYNPSLSPLLSALDRLRFRERDFSCICDAQLTELAGAKISQYNHVSSVLSAIAPRANLYYEKNQLLPAERVV